MKTKYIKKYIPDTIKLTLQIADASGDYYIHTDWRVQLTAMWSLSKKTSMHSGFRLFQKMKTRSSDNQEWTKLSGIVFPDFAFHSSSESIKLQNILHVGAGFNSVGGVVTKFGMEITKLFDKKLPPVRLGTSVNMGGGLFAHASSYATLSIGTGFDFKAINWDIAYIGSGYMDYADILYSKHSLINTINVSFKKKEQKSEQ